MPSCMNRHPLAPPQPVVGLVSSALASPPSKSFCRTRQSSGTDTFDWYGKGERTLELCAGTALWYHPGKEPLSLRWVLTRDPAGKKASRAFFSLDLDQPPKQIVADFMKRWSLEVTYEESRAHLGIETQRQWSDLAIERTTPLLFGLYSL